MGEYAKRRSTINRSLADGLLPCLLDRRPHPSRTRKVNEVVRRSRWRSGWRYARRASRVCWTRASALASAVGVGVLPGLLIILDRLLDRPRSFFGRSTSALKVGFAAVWNTTLATGELRAYGNMRLEGMRRRLARLDRYLIGLRYDLQNLLMRHGAIIIGTAILGALIATFLLAPALQNVVGGYFDNERFALLRGLFASTGGALVSATAIGFSVVMIAVQLNFARMPHALFRRLSSDRKLLGAFAGTFLLAIGVSALSIVPNTSWAALALIAAVWGALLILILFLYGYRRALYLVNPAIQLRLIVEDAQKDLRLWGRRAERIALLLSSPLPKEADEPDSKYDLPRLAFFRANPLWTAKARRAVAHAVSFARRYAEQDDLAVSGRALEAVIVVNASYVAAKGKNVLPQQSHVRNPRSVRWIHQ
jgi:hypothetical protein